MAVSSTNVLSEIDGIRLSGGVVTCANNIINIGTGLGLGYKLYGIFENSGASVTNVNNIYFNTIYVGGIVTAGTTSSTAALWNSNNTNIRNIRNNILFNARSGGATGKHYAIRVGGTRACIDFNDYYVITGVLGSLSGDRTTLALWQTATGQDANSLNVNTGFTNAGGTLANDYLPSVSLPGVTGTGTVTDFNGLTRGAVPKMGALEANYYEWQGGVSTDFASAAGNWVGGVVPIDGADITFAANPDRSCMLDQNRTLKNFTNAQATDNFNANGHQLTITGNLVLSNGAQIDATTSLSAIVFAGLQAQSIPSGSFVSNTIDGLTINNSNGVTLNGPLLITSSLTLTNGVFTLGANSLTINGSITNLAGTLSGVVQRTLPLVAMAQAPRCLQLHSIILP